MDALLVIQGFLSATGDGWVEKDRCAVFFECRRILCEGKRSQEYIKGGKRCRGCEAASRKLNALKESIQSRRWRSA